MKIPVFKKNFYSPIPTGKEAEAPAPIATDLGPITAYGLETCDWKQADRWLWEFPAELEASQPNARLEIWPGRRVMSVSYVYDGMAKEVRSSEYLGAGKWAPTTQR